MRRSRFDIIVDILTTSIEGVNKTKIVYDANLNFKVAKEYLDFLIEAGLLEEISKSIGSTNITFQNNTKQPR
jgi:predicted transcriptional regulator